MQFRDHQILLSVLLALFAAAEEVLFIEARPQVKQPTSGPAKTSSNSSDVYGEAMPSSLGNIPSKTASNSSMERVRILTQHPAGLNRGNLDVDEVLPGDQDIIFPDSLEYYRLDKTPQCAGSDTFCEDIESYPYDHLNEVLPKSKNYHQHQDLFGKDDGPDVLANRIGESEDTYLCGGMDRTVYPKVGKTKNNQWKYIVNQDQTEFVQGVRVETCRGVDRPCELIGNLPNGYTTTCKQKFVYRRMLAVADGGQPAPDTFLMPSACCCSYRRDTQFLARFGSPVTSAATST